MDLSKSARRVEERIQGLAAFTEVPGELTRTFLSGALKQAGDALLSWMAEAGLSPSRDAIGNVSGRLDGFSPTGEPDPTPKTLILGSHLDTVRDAGKYDGALGVLVALEVAARIRASGANLPFNIEVIAFSDEEGVRYHTAYLGSSAVAGTFDPALLDRVDESGITMRDAVLRFGGDPDLIPACARKPGELLGYVEVHMEQGPVLEAEGLPVGIVTGIAGQGRIAVEFHGASGHAGTTPMPLRRDALCAAAEFVLSAESEAQAVPGLVATVGQLAVKPGASNVIPGNVALSLDVRHHDDGVRLAACERWRQRAHEIAGRRQVSCRWNDIFDSKATPCSDELSSLLARAVSEAGWPVRRLPSMAGHDAVSMAAVAPVAMLFVRCREGISHSPLESVSVDDIAVAIDVVERFVYLLAGEPKATDVQQGGSP